MNRAGPGREHGKAAYKRRHSTRPHDADGGARAELAGVRVSNFGSLHHRCAGRRCGLRLMQPPARDPIALVNILDLTADRRIFSYGIAQLSEWESK